MCVFQYEEILYMINFTGDRDSGLRFLKPEALITGFEHYFNAVDNLSVQVTILGLVCAIIVCWLRYTYFTEASKWLNCSKKLLDMLSVHLSPSACLFVLWLFPFFQKAFDLHLFIYLHQMGNTQYQARAPAAKH